MKIIDRCVGKAGHVKETPAAPSQLTHLTQPGDRRGQVGSGQETPAAPSQLTHLTQPGDKRGQVRPGYNGPDSVGSGGTRDEASSGWPLGLQVSSKLKVEMRVAAGPS